MEAAAPQTSHAPVSSLSQVTKHPPASGSSLVQGRPLFLWGLLPGSRAGEARARAWVGVRDKAGQRSWVARGSRHPDQGHPTPNPELQPEAQSSTDTFRPAGQDPDRGQTARFCRLWSGLHLTLLSVV